MQCSFLVVLCLILALYSRESQSRIVSICPRFLTQTALFSIVSPSNEEQNGNSDSSKPSDTSSVPAGVVCKDGVCELPTKAPESSSQTTQGSGSGDKKKTLRSRMLDLESKVMSEWNKATTSKDENIESSVPPSSSSLSPPSNSPTSTTESPVSTTSITSTIGSDNSNSNIPSGESNSSSKSSANTSSPQNVTTKDESIATTSVPPSQSSPPSSTSLPTTSTSTTADATTTTPTTATMAMSGSESEAKSAPTTQASSTNTAETSISSEGVLSQTSASKDTSKPTPEDIDTRVNELTKMGWKKDEAIAALSESGYDVGAAAGLLEEEQEKREELLAKVKELGVMGWSDDAAESALRETQGNVTMANLMLEQEEAVITEEFESSVKGMVENGWEEIVARQALMAQWTLDQRKAQGLNNTVDPAVLQKIKPTLRRLNETEGGASATDNLPTSATSSKRTQKGSQQKQAEPTPAKKEDCVFEVTAQNFQKIVLESPVPVLVDVYADWCGPCKQLGPILETAAMKSGGMFRLAKVNSDNERGIAEALSVTGLPTVYAINKGKFTDKFVGMLPQDQLQTFLIRSITGFGERVQTEATEKDFRDATAKISSLAGLAALDGRKRERLRKLVDEALELPGGLDAEFKLSDGVKTALLYISNAAKDIRNGTYRSINMNSKAYSERISGNEAAVKILEIAGFRSPSSSALTNATSASASESANATVTKTTTTDAAKTLELVHYNAAVLTLVSQRVGDTVQKAKFSGLKQSSVKLGASGTMQQEKNKQTAKESGEEEEEEEEEEGEEEEVENGAKEKETKSQKSTTKEKKNDPSKMTITARLSDTSPVKQSLSPSTTLKAALDTLSKGTIDEKWTKVEIRTPPPRRFLTQSDAEMDKPISALVGEGDVALSLAFAKEASSDASAAQGVELKDKKSNSKLPKAFGKKKIGGKDKSVALKATNKKKRGGTHTLLSTGILSAKTKKNNEYFGGDSTVTVAGEEDEDDDDDDEEDEGEGEGEKDQDNNGDE